MKTTTILKTGMTRLTWPTPIWWVVVALLALGYVLAVNGPALAA